MSAAVNPHGGTNYSLRIWVMAVANGGVSAATLTVLEALQARTTTQWGPWAHGRYAARGPHLMSMRCPMYDTGRLRTTLCTDDSDVYTSRQLPSRAEASSSAAEGLCLPRAETAAAAAATSSSMVASICRTSTNAHTLERYGFEVYQGLFPRDILSLGASRNILAATPPPLPRGRTTKPVPRPRANKCLS